MSTLKVSSIQNPSASTASITLAADGSMTGSFPAPNRNLLYNGAMQVAQRSASVASITANGYYTADRWLASLTSIGTWTQSVESDAPTGSGFRNSLKMLCTTADAAPAASDQLSIRQLLEGQDVQRIAKGTSDAQQLSLSFWVKANVTGTYVVELFDADNTRQVSESYTVSASATWEKKTIALPADTTGAFDNDNAGSLICLFWLAAGSTFTSGTLNTSWASSTNANRAVGQTNLAAATDNYWQVTGVQLEVGAAPTAFEFKSFGQELRECQRYYYRISGGGSFRTFGSGQCTGGTGAQLTVHLPVSMRVSPTSLDQTGTAANYALFNSVGGSVALSSVPTLTTDFSSPTVVFLGASVSSGLSAGNATALFSNNNATAYLGFSAEL